MSVRDHAQERLVAATTVTALVGARVYGRRGRLGGISPDLTPEAFTGDGEILPSLVVVEEVRDAAQATKGGPPLDIHSVHSLAVWCYQHGGYDVVDDLLRAVRGVLHRHTPAGPLAGLVWIDCRWDSDGPDQVDPDIGLDACLRVARFNVTTREVAP